MVFLFSLRFSVNRRFRVGRRDIIAKHPDIAADALKGGIAFTHPFFRQSNKFIKTNMLKIISEDVKRIPTGRDIKNREFSKSPPAVLTPI